MAFDDMKLHNGKPYTGMPVGRTHNWVYHNADWMETKMTPDLWKFRFDANKSRHVPAPVGSGAQLQTGYHWLVIGDQLVIKTNKDDYQTTMQGLKFKVGHKRPHWKMYSYGYNGQVPYKQKVIGYLTQAIIQLQQEVQDELEKGQVNLLLDSF